VRQEAYYCKHCGKPIPPEGVYCKQCGLPLGSSFREETGERRRGRDARLLSGPGRYQVELELSRTGRMIVQKARDLRLGRLVLIRRAGSELLASPDGLSVFLRNVRLGARLRHPGIAALFEEGSDKDGPFSLGEYIEGETLEQQLASGRRLGLRDVIRIGVELADSLQYAHEQGVVHGALTPRRILLENGSGRSRILSFGRVELPELPSRHTPFDSPTLSVLNPHIEDDIYSLGMVLRAGLLGSAGGLDDAAMPLSLREILGRSLSPLPKDRWLSMAEFRDSLSSVGGRRLKARDGRCPECGALDHTDNPFCGQCGSDLRDMFRTCDGCGHRQHQRHVVCGACGSNLDQQGKLALEQCFLALLAGAWDAVARELERMRLLGAEYEPMDAEHGAGVLLQVSRSLEVLWREARWEPLQVALPLVGEAARTLGISLPSALRQVRDALNFCTRRVAEAEDFLREKRLSEAWKALRECARKAPALPERVAKLNEWNDSMIQWVSDRLEEAQRAVEEGRFADAQQQLDAAMEHLHKEDPLALRALRVLASPSNHGVVR